MDIALVEHAEHDIDGEQCRSGRNSSPAPPVRAPAAIARVSGWQGTQAAARFVADSSLEGTGFEPSVPP